MEVQVEDSCSLDVKINPCKYVNLFFVYILKGAKSFFTQNENMQKRYKNVEKVAE